MIGAHVLGFYDQIDIPVGPAQDLVGRQYPPGISHGKVGLANMHSVGIYGCRQVHVVVDYQHDVVGHAQCF